MNRRSGLSALLAGAFLTFTVTPICAAEGEDDAVAKRLDSSPRHHEWIEIKTKQGRTVRAFQVFPEVDRPVAAVLVIHENRGLSDWVRSVADQLAEAGYVALAPDLLSQTGPDRGGTDSFATSDAARDGIYSLPPAQVLDDLDACAAHLARLEAVDRTVAVAGFCWGGSQTFNYVAHNPKISAAFVFYGSAPAEDDALRKIAAPVFGFYGGSDFRITGKVPETTERMKRLDRKYDPVVYEKAGHGFMRAGEAPDASDANRKARDQAWARWKELLKKLSRTKE
jgi:carboxymethylenebutenolidase